MRPSLIVAAALVAACASVSPPAGGPEDKAPPRVLRVTPDTNSVNVKERVASFYFDEIINDRGTGAGDVSNFFLVSPSDGEPRVSWHRSRIDVRPRRGFRPNTAYTITLLPGLTDLRSNTMKAGGALIFSTGPTIPALRITGRVFDWAAERTAPNALVEALTPDSIRYLAQADTGGKFEIGPLGPGTYLVRGIVDANSNRALDRTEAWDSVRVTAPQSAPIELLTAPRDTMAARVLSVSTIDSLTIRLTFDRLLDPTQTIPMTNVRVVGADSTPLPLAATRTPREETAHAKALQDAAADSARRADSLAGKPLAPIPAPRPAAAAAADTAGPPKPSRPAPFTTITIALGQPYKPNTTYRASVKGIKALSGRVADSERQFTTPKPPPPRPAGDSTAAPAAAPGATPGSPNPAPAPAQPPATIPSAVPPLPTTRPVPPTGSAPPARP